MTERFTHLALLKHTGCLQDAWNSVGCFRNDYHTISEDTGGARRLSDDTQSMYQLIFHWCFRVFVDFAKIKETQQKSMKINKKQWKSVDTSTVCHQRDAGHRPCPLILCGNHPQSTPHYSKHPGDTRWAWGGPNRSVTQVNLENSFLMKFWFF